MNKVLSYLVYILASIIVAPVMWLQVLYRQPKRVMYIFSGYFLVPFLNAWCVLKNKDEYPKWAYYWGAYEEDGIDGDKLGWYSNHLGYSFAHLTKWQRYMIMWRWWHRNSCFNLRWHPTLGIPVQEAKVLEFEGNTWHTGQDHSFEPKVYDTKWYRCTYDITGKKHTSTFIWLKLFGEYRLYLRWGLKTYPNYYLDPWWIEKIKNEGWPDYKESGVYVGMMRMQKVEF